MISECHRFCIELMENRESGWNPERYRHCMRGGTAHDESRSLGVNPEKAVRKAYDTQVRRPAQVVKVYLLLSYGEMGYFVAKKRQQQSCMTAAFCIPENHALDAWFKRPLAMRETKNSFCLCEVELQIPHSVCAEVPKKSILQRKAGSK